MAVKAGLQQFFLMFCLEFVYLFSAVCLGLLYMISKNMKGDKDGKK